MNKKTSISNMTTVFILEKTESSLENLKNHDSIGEDIEVEFYLNRILSDILLIKERILENE